LWPGRTAAARRCRTSAGPPAAAPWHSGQCRGNRARAPPRRPTRRGSGRTRTSGLTGPGHPRPPMRCLQPSGRVRRMSRALGMASVQANRRPADGGTCGGRTDHR
jgi:hypothetical protein